MKDLYEYQKNRIWIKEYPIHYAGVNFNSRMTVIRLLNGHLFIHSPCEIDEKTQVALECLGQVEFIVAPGSYHYLHVESAQRAFPDAETFICPGIERKKPELEFDSFNKKYQVYLINLNTAIYTRLSLNLPARLHSVSV